MATATKELKAIDLTTTRGIAKAVKQMKTAERQIEVAQAKQFAGHAKVVETSLATSVKDFEKFAANPDFYSQDCVMARITTLVRLDQAMGRISLRVAHQLGCDLFQLRIWEVPMGGWKDKVLSLGMEYRRSVRYILIGRVFPDIECLEVIGITTVSAALDACQMAKKRGWLIKTGIGNTKAFDISQLDDLKQALADADVDRSKYEEQHFFPAPEKPKCLTTDKDGDSTSESDSETETAETTETETQPETETESETTEEDISHNLAVTRYDQVYEALDAVQDTLRDLDGDTTYWQEIVSAGPTVKDTLLDKLRSLEEYITSLRDDIIEATSDEAPPIEHDTADDMEDETEDTSIESEGVSEVHE